MVFMKDKLGQLFKTAEAEFDLKLKSQTPVLIRLDGRAFRTYTRSFKKPFDFRLHKAMVATAAFLCKEIQNTRFAYTQSDEISILLYEKNEEAQPWFGNRVLKIVSVAAALATAEFNRAVTTEMLNAGPPYPHSPFKGTSPRNEAIFDARVLNLKPSQVQSYFVWRQMDAIRNSVSGLAQTHFSQKELHKKNRQNMLEMLKSEGIEWTNLEDWERKGSIIVKTWAEKNGEIVHRSQWIEGRICPWFKTDEAFIKEMLRKETPTCT